MNSAVHQHPQRIVARIATFTLVSALPHACANSDFGHATEFTPRYNVPILSPLN